MDSSTTNKLVESAAAVNHERLQGIIDHIDSLSITHRFGNQDITYLPNDSWDLIATPPNIKSVVDHDTSLDGIELHSDKSAFVDDIYANGRKLFLITIKAHLGMRFLYRLMYDKRKPNTIMNKPLPLLFSTDTTDLNVPKLKGIPLPPTYHNEFTNKFQFAQSKMWATTLTRAGDLIPTRPFRSHLPFLLDPEPIPHTTFRQFKVRFHPAHLDQSIASDQSYTMRVFNNEVLARDGMASTTWILLFRCEGHIYCVF
jgi:hypothetical protein